MSKPAVPFEEITRVKARADRLYTREALATACDAMATAITTRLGERQPLLLCVMTGGLVPMAMLLERLEFPLQVDYLHLTRYGAATSGGAIEWIRRPPESVRGRCVLVIDDLLDHGLTLQAAREECLAMGASEAYTAALVVKRMAQRPGLQQVDFHAVETPDRYLFGYGMDYKTWWRNGDGVFAVEGL